MSAVLEEHLRYLGDKNKLALYASALARCIQPNDIVLDLGCGTGVLGMLACRAGARRVYAVDSGGIINSAKSVAIDNGYADRVVHVRGRSLDIVLPEPATLIVSDQLGPMGFEAGVLQFSADAMHRLATPNARLLPSSVTTMLAPVQHAGHGSRVAAWSPPYGDLTFERFRLHAANSTYPMASDFGQLLAAGVAIWQLPLADPSAKWSRLDGEGACTIDRVGQLNGLLGWFIAEMGEDLSLTNAPNAQDRVNRACLYLPLDPPIDVCEGDNIVTHLHAVPGTGLLTWRATVSRADATIARWSHSTLLGNFALIDDMASGRPSARPSLSPLGRAKVTLLASCDCGLDIRALAAVVAAQHPSLFPAASDAVRFVRQTLLDLRSDVRW